MRLSKIELIFIILILTCGVTLEYVDEVVMSKGELAPDVFPSRISQFDSTLMLKVNPGMLNPVLNTIFTTITHFGSSLAVALFGIILYIAGYKREGILILASIVIGTLVLAPLKLIVHRPRPYLTLHDVIPLEKEAGASFPSGHSERAFALASLLTDTETFKKSYVMKLILYTYSTLIAFSRVYIGVHYPLDVIAGSVLGWIVGKVTLKIESQINTIYNKVFN